MNPAAYVCVYIMYVYYVYMFGNFKYNYF